jgi:hypothetical protein
VTTRWPGPSGPPALEREGAGDVAGFRRASAFVLTGGVKKELAMGCRRGEGGDDEVAGSRRTLRARAGGW